MIARLSISSSLRTYESNVLTKILKSKCSYLEKLNLDMSLRR